MPETQYARSGEVYIAYQLFGSGPLDLVVIPGAISHVEMAWDVPGWVRLYERLASFASWVGVGGGVSLGVAATAKSRGLSPR